MRTLDNDVGILQQRVLERTHHRVKSLAITVESESITLSGVVGSYHLKQLAQHGILDVMPRARLINSIQVVSSN